jgi:hypothetical protein
MNLGIFCGERCRSALTRDYLLKVSMISSLHRAEQLG